MKSIKRKSVLIFTLVFAFILISTVADAQCSMCRMSADQGSSEHEGLNIGILYLFVAPYLLIGTLAYLWYRKRRKKGEELTVFDEE